MNGLSVVNSALTELLCMCRALESISSSCCTNAGKTHRHPTSNMCGYRLISRLQYFLATRSFMSCLKDMLCMHPPT